MAFDPYDILDIPGNANDVWIRHAYDLRRDAIAKDATLGDAERQNLLKLVERAYGVLTDPEARAEYDEKRLTVTASTAAPKERSTFSGPRIAIWGALLTLLLVTAFVLWRQANYEERMREEEARTAAEITARMKEVQARDKALYESQSIRSSVEESRAKQEANDALNKKSRDEKR